jgi:hypothetical protein
MVGLKCSTIALFLLKHEISIGVLIMRVSEIKKLCNWFCNNWPWIFPIAALGGFLCLLSKYPKLVGAEVFSAESADKLGQFGDYIGGLLNPLISCFTLMVAIIVWRLQKSEIKKSEQQRREARFFDLMKIYQNTVDATFSYKGTIGKVALQLLSEGASTDPVFAELMKNSDSTHGNVLHRRTRIELLWPHSQTKTTPYFRMVFQVLGQLEGLLKESHFEFSKLFRAQLSNEELALIAWCLLHSENADAAKLLIAKYGLLKHLHEGTLRRLVLADGSISKHVFGRKFAEKRSTT